MKSKMIFMIISIILITNSLLIFKEIKNINNYNKSDKYLLEVEGYQIIRVIEKNQLYKEDLKYDYIEYEPILIDEEDKVFWFKTILNKEFDTFRFAKSYKDFIEGIDKYYFKVFYIIDEDGSVVVNAAETRETKEFKEYEKEGTVEIIKEVLMNDKYKDYVMGKEIYAGNYLIDFEEKKIKN